MGLAELLHPALHALPDVTLAVDPQTLRVLDVNRAREAFGHDRGDLGAMGLDALVAMPREDLVRFVQAADGRPSDVGVRLKGGAIVHTSARAASSAGAAAAPCVLVVIRESPEHARALEEVDRIRRVLGDALGALERVSMQRRTAAAPRQEDDVTADAPAPLALKLTLAQYVALCVESELVPARIREINERYGLPSDGARALIDRAFRDKLAADPALEAERAALHARYVHWFQTQGRARQESGVLPAPAVAAPPPQPQAAPYPAGPAEHAPPADLRGVRATAPSPAVPPAPATPFTSPAVAPAPATPFTPPGFRPLPLPGPPPQAAAPQPPAPDHTETQPPITQPTADMDLHGTIATMDVRAGASALPFKPAGTPDLSVDQYAALTVEMEAYPDRRAEVLGRYGIHSEAIWRACEEHWTARLVGDAALRQRWMQLGAELRKRLVRS